MLSLVHGIIVRVGSAAPLHEERWCAAMPIITWVLFWTTGAAVATRWGGAVGVGVILNDDRSCEGEAGTPIAVPFLLANRLVETIFSTNKI